MIQPHLSPSRSAVNGGLFWDPALRARCPKHFVPSSQQQCLNLPICARENDWEIAETIEFTTSAFVLLTSRDGGYSGSCRDQAPKYSV